MIDPLDVEARKFVEEQARARVEGVQGTHPYLVLPDQFLAVLERVYGVSARQVEEQWKQGREIHSLFSVFFAR